MYDNNPTLSQREKAFLNLHLSNQSLFFTSVKTKKAFFELYDSTRPGQQALYVWIIVYIYD